MNKLIFVALVCMIAVSSVTAATKNSPVTPDRADCVHRKIDAAKAGNIISTVDLQAMASIAYSYGRGRHWDEDKDDQIKWVKNFFASDIVQAKIKEKLKSKFSMAYEDETHTIFGTVGKEKARLLLTPPPQCLMKDICVAGECLDVAIGKFHENKGKQH